MSWWSSEPEFRSYFGRSIAVFIKIRRYVQNLFIHPLTILAALCFSVVREEAHGGHYAKRNRRTRRRRLFKGRATFG